MILFTICFWRSVFLWKLCTAGVQS